MSTDLLINLSLYNSHLCFLLLLLPLFLDQKSHPCVIWPIASHFCHMVRWGWPLNILLRPRAKTQEKIKSLRRSSAQDWRSPMHWWHVNWCSYFYQYALTHQWGQYVWKPQSKYTEQTAANSGWSRCYASSLVLSHICSVTFITQHQSHHIRLQNKNGAVIHRREIPPSLHL